MTKDLDRKIVTITYNLLNLPDTVQFSNGNQIVNLYAADGRKLRTDYYTQVESLNAPITEGDILQPNPASSEHTGTIYAGSIEYEIDTDGIYLKRIHNPEGYFADNNYHYYRRDHLGNNREVWNATANATVQKTQYYSSGLPWATNIGDNAGLQPYKYNGKEFIEMHGLDEYYSNFRNYYPAITRTTTMDPLAEKYYSISPYAWTGNNPIRYIDPDGRDHYRYDDKTGEFHLMETNDEQYDQVCHYKEVKNKETGEKEYVLKTNRKGEAKTRIDNIEKGILNDGINFMRNDNVIAIGGEGQATVDGVEAFAVNLSDMVGKEIKGAYFSKDGAENTTHISIGSYQNNTLTKSGSSGHALWQRMNPDLKLGNHMTGFFHTHPTIQYSVSDRTMSSGQDRQSRNAALKLMPHLRFWILTHPINYGDKFPYKKEYTTEW
jgi:RHS repeat-associated protein